MNVPFLTAKHGLPRLLHPTKLSFNRRGHIHKEKQTLKGPAAGHTVWAPQWDSSKGEGVMSAQRQIPWESRVTSGGHLGTTEGKASVYSFPCSSHLIRKDD